ncbi:branched-chain amino acid ABC transporter permease [Polymorphospora rubra]|uniref:Amino acid ABC transporter permease n=1 Tax=Polymorphospora rubra TaxID=338584 RepID=A0A810N846_9ACTN|nr:branched-chain amino acid ABC transporter permease [Polymorphospora rubra]BCJ68319.1 amino acid ABC transporter permease [Polymorphospora rubra]
MTAHSWTRFAPAVAPAIVGAAVLTILTTAPGMGGYLLTLTISAVMYAYLAQCWNIVGGYAGRFSFGHAAFFGVGAYTTAVLGTQYGVNPWLGTAIGAVLAAVLGVALAAVSFRFGVRGPYFALSTLALAETLRVVFTNWEIVGAARGVMVDYLPGAGWGQFQFTDRLPYLYLIIGLAIGVTILVWALDRHRIGLYLRALREDETVAASLGVDCQRYATYASALSAGLTAVGGAFYTQWLLFIEAPTVYGVEISIAMVIPVLLGGVGTVWGPLLGSLALAPIQEGARALFRDRPGADLVVYGIVIAVVIVFLPRGIAGLFDRAPRTAPPPPPAARPADEPGPADPVVPVSREVEEVKR